jgi:hypothetical protein
MISRGHCGLKRNFNIRVLLQGQSYDCTHPSIHDLDVAFYMLSCHSYHYWSYAHMGSWYGCPQTQWVSPMGCISVQSMGEHVQPIQSILEAFIRWYTADCESACPVDTSCCGKALKYYCHRLFSRLQILLE